MVVVLLMLPASAQAAPAIATSRALPAGLEEPLHRWHMLGPIVFSRSRGGDADLWLVRADGSRLERLTRGPKNDTEPAWVPHGANVTFVRTGSSGRPDLFAMNTRRGRPSVFLRDAAAPAWSPDGSRVAFVRTDGGNTDIYTAASDGTDLVRVTSEPGVDTEPAWGPAGSRITFASDRDGDFDIYSAAADGSDVRAVTDDAVDQRNPWDPWTWRDVGYDQGPETTPTWCWQTIGIPAALPGSATSCADPGEHSYAIGTTSAWLEAGANGVTHLWAHSVDGPRQVTSGRRSDDDPAIRQAAPGLVRAQTSAAGDVDAGLQGAKAWVDEHGSATGADESATGLIVKAPSLCLIGAAERSDADATSCDAGSGTGSTSVYADADEVALARDTGVGFCLWVTYRLLFDEGWTVLFGLTSRGADCTGNDARSSSGNAW